jgi:hypothetical protein
LPPIDVVRGIFNDYEIPTKQLLYNKNTFLSVILKLWIYWTIPCLYINNLLGPTIQLLDNRTSNPLRMDFAKLDYAITKPF